MAPHERRDAIMAVAVDLARVNGYNKITRDAIADQAGVSMGLVTRYFGTMNQLRRAIMRHAIDGGVVEIVAQGLAIGDEHAKKASPELKQQASNFLINS